MATTISQTRFGTMKHLRVLESARLVLTQRSGREKLHFLNPVPIRLIYEQWISKFTANLGPCIPATSSAGLAKAPPFTLNKAAPRRCGAAPPPFPRESAGGRGGYSHEWDTLPERAILDKSHNRPASSARHLTIEAEYPI